MAKKTGGRGDKKKAVEAMVKQHPDAGAKELQRLLAEKGVDVSVNYIGIVKNPDGKKGKGKRGGKGGGELLEAAVFALQCGGCDKAQATLAKESGGGWILEAGGKEKAEAALDEAEQLTKTVGAVGDLPLLNFVVRAGGFEKAKKLVAAYKETDATRFIAKCGGVAEALALVHKIEAKVNPTPIG